LRFYRDQHHHEHGEYADEDGEQLPLARIQTVEALL
jgi:hypothetical protein